MELYTRSVTTIRYNPAGICAVNSTPSSCCRFFFRNPSIVTSKPLGVAFMRSHRSPYNLEDSAQTRLVYAHRDRSYSTMKTKLNTKYGLPTFFLFYSVTPSYLVICCCYCDGKATQNLKYMERQRSVYESYTAAISNVYYVAAM